MPASGSKPSSCSWPAKASRCLRALGALDHVGREVSRCALGAEAAVLGARLWPDRLPRGSVGDEDLAGPGSLGEPGGDVDVDAEVVAADLARAADVDPGAQLRPVSLDLDQRRPLGGGEGGLDRACRRPRRRAISPSPSRFTTSPRRSRIGGSTALLKSRSSRDRRRSPASRAQLEKPTRSVKRTATSTLPRPRSWRSESRCQACRAVRPSSPRTPGVGGAGGDQLAGRQVSRATAGGGEQVDELVVAHRPLPRLPRRGDQFRVPVEPARRGGDPLRQRFLGGLGHRVSLRRKRLIR